MMRKIITIVFGGSTNALGQIRAIHQAGYSCINVVEKCMHAWSRKSKYCKGYLAPHPYNEKEACLRFVRELIQGLDSKPFLFFASDDWMDFVGENEKEFRRIAHLPQMDWAGMHELYNKKFLYRIAEENNIPYPKTIELDSLEGVSGALDTLQPPYIVKPQTTVSQNEVAKAGVVSYHRTQKFNDKAEAMGWVYQLLSNNVDFPVLAQEFIPGDATKLYTLTSFSNKDGELIAGSVGHKLRQFPPVAGRITSGVLEHNEVLFEQGKRFLKLIKYYGLANTEFKLDERDGKFKLMEINTRLGAWNYSTLYAGLNLIKVAVEDYQGKEYKGIAYTREKDGAVWYNFSYDLAAALVMNKRIGEKEHSMSYRQWKKSLGKNHFEAVWDWRDMKPFIWSIASFIKKVL